MKLALKPNVFWPILVMAGTPLPILAGTASIGIVSAVATYSLNDAARVGASSISDGATVTTTTAPSDIRLDNGAQVRLATRSTGTVFSDHLSLSGGAVHVGAFTDYSIRVHNLEIVGDSPSAEAIIRVNQRTVEVASLGGSVRVSDGGALMTRVASGTKIAFRPQASTTGASPGGPSEPDERDTLLWTVVGVSAAALAIGGIAAYQGKSPF